MADAVDAAAPALIIPVPFVKRIEGGRGPLRGACPIRQATARALIVWLDAERLRQQLLEPLVAKYFGTGDASEYLVSIVPARRVRRPSSTPRRRTRSSTSDADVSTGMFDLRMNEMTRLPGIQRRRPARIEDDHRPRGGDDRPPIEQPRRRRARADDRRSRTRARGWCGRATAAARSRASSRSSRRRNLAISAGVLGLLGAAFVLVIAAAQRQRRLARQQMEFVASVSHELRTPLAVICSAGENLADGVVADAAQVKTYGSLIETEGRRLGDMVERVMEFAGISSGAPMRVPRATSTRRR